MTSRPLGGRGYVIEALPVITTDLRSRRIDGFNGRDVLKYSTGAPLFTSAGP